jgi:hypothetical protein
VVGPQLVGRPGDEPVIEPGADELAEYASSLRTPLVEPDEDAADEAAWIAADIGCLLWERQTVERNTRLIIKNASGQPVYDIDLGLGIGGGNGSDRRLPVLMPGADYELVGLGTDFADGRRQIWITFRDSAGVRWRTTSDGHLTEVSGKAVLPGA